MEINQKTGSNRIIITEPYFEKVRFRRRELYANYDLLISPKTSNLISISYDETINNNYLNRLPYYLPNYIEKLQNLDISITGLDFHLSNHKVHPTDSKSISYDISLFFSFLAMIQRHDTVYKVDKAQLSCTDYQFKEDKESIKFSNTIYKMVRLNENKLYHKQTIAITNSYILEIKNSNLVIRLQTNISNLDFEYQNNYRKKHISLHFKKSEFSWDEINAIKKVVRLIKKNIYDKQLNLRGFNLSFSKYDQKKIINEHTIQVFEWAIRNLLADKSSITVINEMDW